ncbi:MAG TPA: DUF72 domain-containing protein [Bacillota bacterium]|nr:DUF72 domain-containing protein [Bacillota bacterium]
MILIGTSGFSFPDWKGPFYPPGIGQKDLLAYYCRFFPAVELNYSYYTMPTASQTLKLSRQVPENFTFTIKAHRSMTHQPQDLKQACTDFKKGIEPLLESGKLGCILWQFPWSFQYSEASLAHIRQLSSLLEGLPNVVEFRHRSWLRPEVEGVLRENQLGYCTVDEPDLACCKGHRENRLRALPRPQPGKMVAEQKLFRALRLPILHRRARSMAAENPAAEKHLREDLHLLQQLPYGASSPKCPPAAGNAGAVAA